MGPALWLAWAVAAQTDLSLDLSVDASTGGGLLGTPRIETDADPNALGENRVGGLATALVRSELLGVGRRFSWGVGADGRVSAQVAPDPNAAEDALVFGGFGADMRGRVELIPTLDLLSDVRGAFQRTNPIGSDQTFDVQDPDTDPNTNQALPFGTAIFESVSVGGGLGLEGLAGRRLSWGAETRGTFTDSRALNVAEQELEGGGNLPSVFSLSGSGFADWSASRRTFVGAGLTGQYAEFSGIGFGRSSVVLTAEGRFRRILSERWVLSLRAGAFINVPIESPAMAGGAEAADPSPALNARLTYIEPPSERVSYQLAAEIAVAPQLNQQLGQVAPEARASLFFDARFDEDWSLAATVAVGSLVFVDAFPQNDEAAMSRPLLQSYFLGSVALERRLTDEWQASLGVRAFGQMRQLFAIDAGNTPEELLGYDVAFPQVLVELGLRWNRVVPL